MSISRIATEPCKHPVGIGHLMGNLITVSDITSQYCIAYIIRLSAEENNTAGIKGFDPGLSLLKGSAQSSASFNKMERVGSPLCAFNKGSSAVDRWAFAELNKE